MLLRSGLRRARTLGLPSVLLTFDPHPHAFFHAGEHRRLYPVVDTVDQAKGWGVDRVHVQPFDAAFAGLEPMTFLEHFLERNFAPAAVVVGFDFRFGARRGGDVATLARWAALGKKEVIVQEPFLWKGEKISSGGVRDLVDAGQVEGIPDLLGRPYSHAGVIVPGQQRGTGLGFPTANLKLEKMMIPLDGVYVTEAVLDGQHWPAVTHVGPAPTVDRSAREIETHVLGERFPALYGKTIEVRYLRRLRDIFKFSGLAELKARIGQDVDEAAAYFRERGLRA